MTFLVSLTGLSFALVAGVLAYASFVQVNTFRGGASIRNQTPWGISDVAILTWREAIHRLDDAWHHFMPWVHTASEKTLSRYLAFRDRMYMRVFGQAAVPRGGATSYFLKRILVHKEEFRKKAQTRQSFHDTLPKESGRSDMITRLLGTKNEG